MGDKNRIDLELVHRGLVRDIKEARALIMAGEILLDGQVHYRADTGISKDHQLGIKEKCPYVSRGGLKLKKALKDFRVDVRGKKIMDIGISTGGFSDLMLKNGADAVLGLDVNIQQVDYFLRKHPGLALKECNARFLKPREIDFDPDIITMDVSFISVLKILPPLLDYHRAIVIVLIKPQFEAGRSQLQKGGVIKDPKIRCQILIELKKKIERLGFSVADFTDAGIRGRKGNQEYFFLLNVKEKKSIDDTIITDVFKI